MVWFLMFAVFRGSSSSPCRGFTTQSRRGPSCPDGRRLELDGFHSRPARGVGVRSVPPHPYPLPWGEGATPARLGSPERSRFAERLGRGAGHIAGRDDVSSMIHSLSSFKLLMVAFTPFGWPPTACDISVSRGKGKANVSAEYRPAFACMMLAHYLTLLRLWDMIRFSSAPSQPAS